MSSEMRSPVWTASDEHGVVAPAGPGAAVGCGEQRVDLGVGEPGDRLALVAFGGDGQHALDRGGVFGMAAARRSRTGSGWRRAASCGCGPCCAGRCSRWSKNAAISGASRSAMSSADGVLPVLAVAKREQQPERVAVAGDGVGRGAALGDEPVGEERLQHRRERGHGRPSSCCSRRAAASCMSSGTADKYQ